LTGIATQTVQHGQLFESFHPFGDRAQADGTGQVDYRGADGPVIAVIGDVSDKRTVDLYGCHR
jgi:hypothetical protein